MHLLPWIVMLLAALEGGWMAFDGLRALFIGDYVTPKNGPYAGQLGPWSKLVSAVGLEPRSTLMKSIFVAYGAAWIVAIVCYGLRLPGSSWAMLVLAAGSLWYLPIGTALGLLQLALLLFLRYGGSG